jgi:NTP pyrophosphatase (non-canonical NTP hydrolase)
MPEPTLPDLYEQLLSAVRGLNRRFSSGDDPFLILTRLLEESGELAKEVNHFEGQGVKREKYGEPDPEHLAKEIMDVMRCALQLAVHYGVEDALAARITYSYQTLLEEGWIETKT